MLFTRIMVPLDGSERAERVLSQVNRFLRREDAELLLVRSVFTPLSLAREDTSSLDADARKEALSYLERTAARLTSQALRARFKLLTGPAESAILEAAREEKASLIAMSTHGRTGLSRWAMGSVADKVVRASDVPLLLLHSFLPDAKGAPAPVGDGLLPFRRILVPLDGSDLGRAALSAAESIARLFEADLMLLHVHKEGMTGDLEPDAERLRRAGLKVSIRWAQGDPALRILEEAESENADLIAMATHGRSGVSRWMLGSVTERVLHRSTTPLLIVRCRPLDTVRPGGP